MKQKRRILPFIALLLVLAFVLSGCEKEDSGNYDKGMEALASEQYDEAIDYFEKAAKLDGRYEEAYRGEGITYFNKGDYKNAVALFDICLKNMSQENREFEEDVLFYKADACTKIGRTDEAIEIYKKLTEGTRPDLAWSMLGVIYLNLGMNEEANEAFQKLEEGEASYETYLSIYQAYVDQRLEADGEKYLEKALALVPMTAQDYLDQGKTYAYFEDTENAKRSLQTAIDRGNLDAVPILGFLDLRDGAITEAREAYEKLLENPEYQAMACNGLALCSLAEGKYADALAYIEQGLACQDTTVNKYLLFNEVVIYEYALDFEKAKEKANEFMKLYPLEEEMKLELKFLSRGK